MNQGEYNGFWESLRELVRTHHLVIDRPKASAHPRYPDFIYPVDYGYLAGTTASDGDGIDVWKGSAGDDIPGIFCTVDLLKKDAEIKIVIGCSKSEIDDIHKALNRRYLRAIYISRL